MSESFLVKVSPDKLIPPRNTARYRFWYCPAPINSKLKDDIVNRVEAILSDCTITSWLDNVDVEPLDHIIAATTIPYGYPEGPAQFILVDLSMGSDSYSFWRSYLYKHVSPVPKISWKNPPDPELFDNQAFSNSVFQAKALLEVYPQYLKNYYNIEKTNTIDTDINKVSPQIFCELLESLPGTKITRL